LKRTLIEASGNGPVIVCADGDLREAAKGAVFGGFYCAGQVCCATERVLVHASAYDDFLEAVVEEARNWRLGDPFDSGTQVGPLNNEPVAAKMERHVDDARARGAVVVEGGSRQAGFPTDLYFQPTVLEGVPADALVSKEETFGPIVPLTRVTDDDVAIAMANDSELGLRAAVYTDSIRTAFRYIDELRVGNVVVNDSTNYGEAHLPFGGASGTRSGWGRMGGRFTMADMTQIQTAALAVR
jgi:succinate-semialdehyde dehydrogenase/glutarate-semialdehyde dehydrogenase